MKLKPSQSLVLSWIRSCRFVQYGWILYIQILFSCGSANRPEGLITGIVGQIIADERDGTWYPSRYLVINPRKSWKITIMFRCSAEHEGLLLSDSLLSVPDCTASLLGVLLWFHQPPVSVATNTEVVFSKVRAPDENTDFLMFLRCDVITLLRWFCL